MDTAEDRMWWYRALHTRLLDALAGIDGPVLDVGCGTGGLLSRVEHGWAVGLDYAPAAARRARQKSGREVVAGSINALPFAPASFAAAVAADVLCHASVEPARALAELRLVLRPGGRLVVNMPAYGWLASAHDRRVQNGRRQTAAQLRRMLLAGGFTPLSVNYWNGLLLPLMVIQRKIIARSADSGSDVAVFPPWLDAMLYGVTVFEQRHTKRLPAGGSILAIATRS